MSVSAVSSSSAASYLQQAKQLGAAKIGDPIDPFTEGQSSTAIADASVTGATAPSGSTPPFGAATMDSLISAQGQATTGSKPIHPHGHHHHVADSDATSSANSSSTSSAASIGEDPIDPAITADSDATVAASATSNNQSISSLMEQLGKMQSQVAGVVAPIVSALV